MLPFLRDTPYFFLRENELFVSEANTAAGEINEDKQVVGEKHVKDDEKVRKSGELFYRILKFSLLYDLCQV